MHGCIFLPTQLKTQEIHDLSGCTLGASSMRQGAASCILPSPATNPASTGVPATGLCVLRVTRLRLSPPALAADQAEVGGGSAVVHGEASSFAAVQPFPRETY